MDIQIFKIHILPSGPTKKYATSIKIHWPLLQILNTTVSKYSYYYYYYYYYYGHDLGM
jgi:hypothetical protein